MLNELYYKWEEIKENFDKINLELKELKKEYKKLIDKKINKLYNRLTLIQVIFSISILIIQYISNPILFFLGLPIIIVYNMIVFLGTFIVSKFTNDFENIFSKDKNINALV